MRDYLQELMDKRERRDDKAQELRELIVEQGTPAIAYAFGELVAMMTEVDRAQSELRR